MRIEMLNIDQLTAYKVTVIKVWPILNQKTQRVGQ